MRWFALAVWLAGLGFPALADALAVGRLGELLAGVRYLQADFEQQLTDANGAVMQQTEGTLLLSHPSRFRWSTQPPFEQLVVSDGQTVWQYDPDLMQVVVRPLDKRADQIPSLLLGGDIDAVSAHYSVTELPASENGGAVRFRLEPLQDSTLFTALELGFLNGRIHELLIADGFEQLTRIRFIEPRMLETSDDSVFVFEPPANADVIYDE